MTCPWLSRSGGKPPSRLALPMVFYSLSCRRDVICVNFSAFLQFVALCTFCPNKNAAQIKMSLPPTRPLGQTLVLCAVVIGTMALGAVILWAATHWLWLVVHQGLH